jgi:hypothetical protein
MQPAGTAAGASSSGKFSDRIKQHPFASGSVMAIAVAAVYLIYQHFHNASSTAAAATTTTGGTGGGATGGGRGHYLGGATGGGSGSGGGSSDSGTGVGTPAPTVDLTGLTSLLSGIQTELGMLGQEIAGIGTGPGTSGGGGGGGGTVKPLPYSALPGVQPVNTLPASAKTVNVPVGGATYAIPYTGDKPSPAIVSQLGTTIAANAGIATNGISAGNIKAAQQAVAAGAGSQAPTGLGTSPQANKAPASLPTKPTTAPKAASGSTPSSQAALANQISQKVAAQPAPKPASTAPKTITTTAGKTEAVNTAGRTSIRPG